MLMAQNKSCRHDLKRADGRWTSDVLASTVLFLCTCRARLRVETFRQASRQPIMDLGGAQCYAITGVVGVDCASARSSWIKSSAVETSSSSGSRNIARILLIIGSISLMELQLSDSPRAHEFHLEAKI